MATATYKILGQAQLGTSPTVLYTCPGAATGGAVVSTLLLANTAGSALTYTLHASNGTVAAGTTCFASAVAIAANDTVALTLGITLSSNGVLQGAANVASQVTAMAFGSEIVN